MIFNKHLELNGKHATFSASSYAWLNYSVEKLGDVYESNWKKDVGTEVHDYAASQIKLHHNQSTIKSMKDAIETFIFQKYTNQYGELSSKGSKLLHYIKYVPKDVFETTKAYINDANGYRMQVEQRLVYSPDFFGTCDAISFRNDMLRIHDLKTGVTKAKMDQLMIYASLFCLEYGVDPKDISTELRIYQSTEVVVHNPEVDDIREIMKKIIIFDNTIKTIQEGETSI